MLRENRRPQEVFAELIRLATNSKWSHSALLYLINDPRQGYNNTFLVEALTKGIHLTSWRNEVVPFEEFTVGIKRPRLDWYVETPAEKAKHDRHDPEDTHAIGYLRHVRGIALDQINGLFDHKVVDELAALYIERVARRHLAAVPQVAQAADALATLSNLSNMQRVIFREDPDHVIETYIQQVQAGKLQLADPMPDDVLDVLKTATPADFNNSDNLQWRYVIRRSVVWKIDEVGGEYTSEADVLRFIDPEHR